MLTLILGGLIAADIIVSIKFYKRYYKMQKALEQISSGTISYPKMVGVALKSLKE